MMEFLIVYFAGVVINSILAAMIWRELSDMKDLERVRHAVMLVFVFLSVVTWVYGLLYWLTHKIRDRKDEY